MTKIDIIAKWLKGISSVIFLFPQENNRKITLPRQSISTTLKNDWEKIGTDMWQAFQNAETQLGKNQHHRNNNDRYEKYF